MNASRLAALALVLALASAVPTRAQCMLANPSFEVGAVGTGDMSGWNRIGRIDDTPGATHGRRGARAVGDLSPWSLSALWQRLDASPESVWRVRLDARADAPLLGGSRGLINVEWRDAAGVLLDFASFDAVDPASPPSDYTRVEVEAPPAPPGTAAVHILVGVLQAPGAPAPVVEYDRVEVVDLTGPQPDDVQWSDFPSGRTIDFAGRRWRVKGPGVYGPGPSPFCDAPSCVDVDADGRLVLSQQAGRSGYSTEVALEDALGYGDYVFTTRGRVDALDPNTVLGLFVWEYGLCYDPAQNWWNPYNEIDIEWSRWGDPTATPGQFVAQPYDWPGNIERFDAALADDEITSHAFRWLSDRVEFRSWRGGPADEASAPVLNAWTYTGPHVPRPERARVHVNLWHLPAGSSTDQRVELEDFRFEAWCEGGPCAATSVSAPPRPVETLRLDAAPNPFRGAVTLRFSLDASAQVDLEVYDVTGRRVRSLASRRVDAGAHRLEWRGEDAQGGAVPSGVYLARLRTSDGLAATARLVVIR